jgi:hypothetical protein
MVPTPAMATSLTPMRARVALLEVVDELRQVLDAIDVVVRRRADQRHPGPRVPQPRDQLADLVRRQLPALARLGALRDLDLDLLRVREVLGRHAEAAGGHLLDLVVVPVAVGLRVDGGVLTALAGVRAGAQVVHGDGERLMRLGAQRAQRHAAGDEAPHDVAGRLDLIERHGERGGDHVEQVAQVAREDAVAAAAELLPRLRVALASGAAGGADGLLQRPHRGGLPGVVLGVVAAAEADAARVRQLDGCGGYVVEWPGGAVPAAHLLLERPPAEAADAAGGAGEAALDDLVAEAEDLEDLAAAVAGHGRDAHLRHHLAQPGLERVDQVALALRAAHLVHRCERQPGRHRVRAAADEHRQVVNVPAVARLRHQADAAAQTDPQQVLVDGAQRERHRQGCGVLVGVQVGQEEAGGAAAHRRLRDARDALERGRQVLVRVQQARHLGAGQQRAPAQRAPRRAVEHRRRQLEQRAVRLLRQQRRARAQPGAQRHHPRLAQRVDRRIGDLGEALREEGVDRPRRAGERRHRGVVAHRPDGLLPLAGHRLDHQRELLARQPVQELQAEQLVRGEVCRRVGEVRLEADELRPLRVGALGGELRLERLVHPEPLRLRVHRQHLPRPEAALEHHVLVVQAEHARLGAGDDQPVVDDLEAAGAQPVTVQRGADEAAVGEGQAGGPVPGLEEGGVEAEEGARVRRYGLAGVLPGGRDEHAHRVRDAAAAAHQQLEGLVERGGVRAALGEGGPHLRGQLRLARPDPGAVGGQRVDLAVVGEHAEGLGELPARERVGREALVEDGDRRLEERVAQVGIEVVQLAAHAERLVDHGPRGQRADVALPAAAHVALARQIEPVLEVRGVAAGRRQHQHLPDLRQRGASGGAERLPLDRHLPPAEHPQPVLVEAALEPLRLAVVLGGQEDHPDADRVGLPRWSASRAKKRRGSCTRMPVPSPLLPSAATAPRCVNAPSARTARRTMSCSGSPEMRATKPTPQASCSKSGS